VHAHILTGEQIKKQTPFCASLATGLTGYGLQEV